jgi:hypothetical protein
MYNGKIEEIKIVNIFTQILFGRLKGENKRGEKNILLTINIF